MDILTRHEGKWLTESGSVAWSSFPDKGSERDISTQETAEEAYEEGKMWVRRYEHNNYPGGMGQVIGVTKKDNGYVPIISTYYSNS